MASPIAHSFLAISITCLANKWMKVKRPAILFLMAMCISILPDFDLMFVLMRKVLGEFHREVSHSLFFGCIYGSIFGALFYLLEEDVLIVKKTFYIVAFFIAIYFSHIILDMFTVDLSAPHGLQIFLPWSKKYYIFPINFLDGLDYGFDIKIFFNTRNIRSCMKELIIFGPVSLLFLYFFRTSR